MSFFLLFKAQRGFSPHSRNHCKQEKWSLDNVNVKVSEAIAAASKLGVASKLPFVSPRRHLRLNKNHAWSACGVEIHGGPDDGNKGGQEISCYYSVTGR